MNVYFEENYWGCRREKEGKRPGEELRLGTVFLWEGRQWQIPAVYVCEEGLVMDLCCRVEPREVKEFYEDLDTEEPAEEEELRLRREHPFRKDFGLEARVNGERVQGRMGCGCCWCPPDLMPGKEAAEAFIGAEEIEEQLMEAYELDLTAGWSFWRNSFAWQKERPDRIRSIDLTITKDPAEYAGPHFQTGPDAAGMEAELVHPVTGNVHKLTVLGLEQMVLPVREIPAELEMEHFPDHYAVLHYQVEPELPREELLISDCAQSDQPARKGKRPAASSISVIGGADGPTSIFLLGGASLAHGSSGQRSANSSLHYEPAQTVEWRTTFRVNEKRKTKVHIQLPEE